MYENMNVNSNVGDRVSAEAVKSGNTNLMAAELLHGCDPAGGDPPISYGPHGISYLYGQQEHNARSINDTKELEEISKSKKTLETFLFEHKTGAQTANRLFTAAREYSDPRSPEEVENLKKATIAKLRETYGSRTDAVLAGANRVAKELVQKDPRFGKYILNGLGSDKRFAEIAIILAKQKKYL